MDENCPICGDQYSSSYSIEISCNCKQKYHYQCILKSLHSQPVNKCPYCRGDIKLLPIVNGLKKISAGIHYPITHMPPEYENKMCDSIIQRGPNKGKPCGNKCPIGYYQCKRHTKK